MAPEEIRTHWEDFLTFAKIVSGDIYHVHSRLFLTEQFVNIMKHFGYDLTDEQVHVATGFWQARP
jgi:hypothetical protein